MTSTGISIGEVARRTGLSVHTLCLYERTGDPWQPAPPIGTP